MVAYELWCKSATGCPFIAILPERREDPRRITYQSVINLGRLILGQSANIMRIVVIKTMPDESTEDQFNIQIPGATA